MLSVVAKTGRALCNVTRTTGCHVTEGTGKGGVIVPNSQCAESRESVELRRALNNTIGL